MTGNDNVIRAHLQLWCANFCWGKTLPVTFWSLNNPKRRLLVFGSGRWSIAVLDMACYGLYALQELLNFLLLKDKGLNGYGTVVGGTDNLL